MPGSVQDRGFFLLLVAHGRRDDIFDASNFRVDFAFQLLTRSQIFLLSCGKIIDLRAAHIADQEKEFSCVHLRSISISMRFPVRL